MALRTLTAAQGTVLTTRNWLFNAHVIFIIPLALTIAPGCSITLRTLRTGGGRVPAALHLFSALLLLLVPVAVAVAPFCAVALRTEGTARSVVVAARDVRWRGIALLTQSTEPRTNELQVRSTPAVFFFPARHTASVRVFRRALFLLTEFSHERALAFTFACFRVEIPAILWVAIFKFYVVITTLTYRDIAYSSGVIFLAFTFTCRWVQHSSVQA